MEPIPLYQFFSLVAEQERQLANNISVYISNINSASSNRITTSILFTFCGKYGHTENVCFKMVGFPSYDDIWGPCSVTCIQGFRYFLTVVDDFSGYTWTIPLHTKYEVHNHLINFHANTKKNLILRLKVSVLIMGLNLL